MRTALLYNFLIEANIMASIAIVLMAALRRFLRRPLGNGCLCFGWLLVAARLALPLSLPNPLINAIRSPFAMDTAIRPIAGQVKVRLMDALDEASLLLQNARLQKGSDLAYSLAGGIEDAHLSISLANVYALGVLAVLAWCIFCNIRFRLRLRTDRIEPISGRLLEQYQALCAEKGVRPVPVYFTDPLPSACLVGVVKPYIALPLTASPQDAIHVLTHEVCHIRNRDNWWNVLRLVCVALHWFNPLVWLAAAMSRTDCELRCDDRVIKGMNPEARKAYASVLVLAAARRSAPGLAVMATGMTMTGKKLRARVSSVLRGSRPLRWLGVSFMLLSFLCLVGAFATAEARAVPRLLRSHPAMNTAEIMSEEDAFAYAQTLWGMDSVRLSDGIIGLTCELYDIDDSGYIVYGNTSVRKHLLLAHFDADGNAVAVWRERFAEDANACDITLKEGEISGLADDLKAWLETVNPGRAKKANFFRPVQEFFDGDMRYIDIACWSSKAAADNDYDVTAYFTVQIAPETRIVYYNINYGTVYGNG